MKKQFINKSSDEFWDFFSKPDKNTETCLLFLRAEVQPTLDLCAEAFCQGHVYSGIISE